MTTIIAVTIVAVVAASAALLAAVKVIKHNAKLAARVDAIETKVAKNL